MTPIQIYQLETGNTQPNNQMEFEQWYCDYVEWLENQFLSLRQKTAVRSSCPSCLSRSWAMNNNGLYKCNDCGCMW